MLNRLLTLLHSGEENADGVYEKRKVHHLNIIVLLTFIISISYILVYLIIDSSNTVLLNSATSIYSFFPLAFITLLLNKKGKLRLARWSISMNFIGIITSLMIFGQGNYFNAHFFYLAFASALFTYFPLSQWKDIVFFFIINLSLFIISHIGVFQPYPEIHAVDADFTAIFSTVNIIASAFVLAGLMFVSEYATETSDHNLQALSTTDSLTGLLNRHGFTTRFEEERLRSGRTESFGALLFFDLNKFKPLNDQYGHNAGDLLLKEVALRLQHSLRKTDVIARIGGDEFIALMCQAGEDEKYTLKQAKLTAEIIRASLAEEYLLETSGNLSTETIKYHCSTSVGIASFNIDSDIEEVLKQADLEMYKDKELSR